MNARVIDINDSGLTAQELSDLDTGETHAVMINNEIKFTGNHEDCFDVAFLLCAEEVSHVA